MNETPTQQIKKLADFILREVPGEPSENEGAIDTAIRVIRKALLLEWKDKREDLTKQMADIDGEIEKINAKINELEKLIWSDPPVSVEIPTFRRKRGRPRKNP